MASKPVTMAVMGSTENSQRKMLRMPNMALALLSLFEVVVDVVSMIVILDFGNAYTNLLP